MTMLEEILKPATKKYYNWYYHKVVIEQPHIEGRDMISEFAYKHKLNNTNWFIKRDYKRLKWNIFFKYDSDYENFVKEFRNCILLIETVYNEEHKKMINDSSVDITSVLYFKKYTTKIDVPYITDESAVGWVSSHFKERSRAEYHLDHNIRRAIFHSTNKRQSPYLMGNIYLNDERDVFMAKLALPQATVKKCWPTKHHLKQKTELNFLGEE